MDIGIAARQKLYPLAEQEKTTVCSYQKHAADAASGKSRKCRENPRWHPYPPKTWYRDSTKRLVSRDSAANASSAPAASEIGARHFIDSEHDATKKNIAERASVAFDTKRKISILGRSFPITVLPESTPLLYQWFHKNEKSVMPELYFSNLVNTCEIETNRKIGLLILKRRANPNEVTKFEQLEKKFKNFHVIDFDSINIDSFNYTIKKEVLKIRFDRDFQLNLFKYPDFHRSIYSSENEHFKVLDVMEHHRFYNFFDAARNFAMLHAGFLFSEKDTDVPTGCIYLDLDMRLTGRIGSIKCVDGFSCILKNENALNIDNSLFCVDRPNHPILLQWLNQMRECRNISVNLIPIPYWRFCGAIQAHYIPKEVLASYTEKMLSKGKNIYENNCSLIPEIAFPLDNIDADQSKSRELGSSWGKTSEVVF